jgi:hypothetical protein
MKFFGSAFLFLTLAGASIAIAEVSCDVSAMLIQGAKHSAKVAEVAPPTGSLGSGSLGTGSLGSGSRLASGSTLAKGATAGVSAEAEEVSGFAPSMREQLSALPSAKYSPLETKSDNVTFGRKAMFSLRDPYGGMHQVEVTPLRSVSGKIHTLVHWRGPDNSSLLSTKLWITNGQNMLLGTQISKDMTLIVNVSVGCRT